LSDEQLKLRFNPEHVFVPGQHKATASSYVGYPIDIRCSFMDCPVISYVIYIQVALRDEGLGQTQSGVFVNE